MKTDVVDWVRDDNKDYSRKGAFPLIEDVSCALMFREIKIKTVQKEVFDHVITEDSVTAGLYKLRRRSWCTFFIVPWRKKVYYLTVGHWKLFKRMLQKLIHLDFSIKN